MLGKLALPEIRELIAAGDEADAGRGRQPLADARPGRARRRAGRRASGSGSSGCSGPSGRPRPSATSTCPTSGRSSTRCRTAESAGILNAMAADDRTALLAELPAAQIAGPDRAARARRARRRPRPARLPRGERRPADDPRLRGRPQGLDDPPRPGPRPRPRPRQRDAERHLRGRRRRPAGRRPADPRDPAGPAAHPRRRHHGRPVRPASRRPTTRRPPSRSSASTTAPRCRSSTPTAAWPASSPSTT